MKLKIEVEIDTENEHDVEIIEELTALLRVLKDNADEANA